eukprot:242202_1
MSSSNNHNWFSSKNIASLKLYYEASLFTRMDLIPFLVLYAFDANVYFYPQIYKDFSQQLLDDYVPNYAHWNFQVYTWSLLGCWFAIFHAFCHVICTLLEYWHLSIRCRIQYIQTNDISKARVAHVIPPPHCGEDALCVMQREPHDDQSIFFTFQQIKYSFQTLTQKFVELDFPTDLPIKHYIDPTPLTDDDAEELKLKYGPNEFNIPMPKFWEVFQEHATAPFFLFQIFCVGLWCLDEYWMYSLFTLFMLVVFEMMMVKRRMGNMKMIRNMRTKPFFVYIYRGRRWQRRSTTEIVPGDTISLVRCHAGLDEDIVNIKDMREETIVPCDVLLLSGTCVVDEALLTGESVPQIKEPIDVSAVDTKLDLKSLHRISLISGGTKIVTSSFDESNTEGIHAPPNDGAVGKVITTGFHTSQGELLRTILFSTSRVSVNNPEAFVFIAILLCFAIVASGYVLYWGLKDETRSHYKLALNCIMIITSVVPPELPMELSLAVNNSMVKLLKQKIFCTEAFRIPFGGAVEVCCFDKTGTLTSDSFQVVGCTKLNIDHKTTQRLQTHQNIMLNEILSTASKKFADDSKYVIAGCHSLIRLEGKIIGDPLEKCALSAMGWSYQKHCASPKNDVYPNVRIWHRFPFSSALKRMSCIVTVTRKKSQQPLVRLVCKGAAETIGERLRSIPSNYNAVHSYFSKQGFRVLALGWKQLNKVSTHKLHNKQYLKSLKRSHLENDLIFAGFLVFACPHKPDSLDTIIQLKASSHAVMMITGDHVLTACAVAKDLYIATKPVLSLQSCGGPNEWKWFNIDSYYDADDEKEGIDFKFETVRDIVSLTAQYDLCLSGRAMKHIRSAITNPSLLSRLLLNVVIYARTSPVQKEFILSSLKELGITTLMCGDGTNDVGALKQAHVGVALLSASAARQVEKAEAMRRKKIEEKKKNTMSRFGMSGYVEKQREMERERKKKEKREREKEREREDDAEMSTQDLQAKMWNELMGQLEGDDDDPDMMMEAKPVQLGDASIASPFTSKQSTIESTIHIIRQGRCTLVTTLQMYSILALNCLISAYSLSVLYLEGVKFGDTQMTITGMMIAALFFFVTQSEPQFYLSQQQPHKSVFSAYIIWSLIGQSVTHLYTLMCAVAWSKPHTPTDEETRDPEGKFKPNVLNTVVFLVSTIQIVATFAANYAGYPFMQSLSDNKKLHRTILALCAVCFACGLGWWPSFDKLMQIAPLPSDEFRSNLLILMAGDLSVVVAWERLCRYMFRKQPNPIVPVNKPPKQIIQKAKKKQREKYLQKVNKQKELAAKNSPWKMMKDMQKQAQTQYQTNQQQH